MGVGKHIFRAGCAGKGHRMGRIRLETAQARPITKHESRRGVLARLMRDEDGSFVIFGLFLFVLMLMIGGMAVDLMRYETHRTRLQSTLDRATLAAASMSQPLPPKAVVMDYMSKAGLGDLIDEDDIDAPTTLTSRRVEVDADIVVDSFFMNFMGIDQLTAPGHSAAEEGASQTEISLVVDVSGSMASNSASGETKIAELREAATQFVNLLQCNPSSGTDTTNCIVPPGKVSISLIPYNAQVAAGKDLLDSLESISPQVTVTSEHSSSHCIHWAEDDFNKTGLDWSDGPLKLQRAGHFDPWNYPFEKPFYWHCPINDWRQIQPLAVDRTKLHAQIDSLEAWGSTSIDLGMKWGTLLLDPSIQPAIAKLATDGVVDNSFSDRPHDYNESGINKYVVLMTDGMNFQQYILHDSKREGLSEVWYNEEADIYSIYRSAYDQYYIPYFDQYRNHPFGQNGTNQTTVCEGNGWWQRCFERVSDEFGDAVQLSYQELWGEHMPWNRYYEFSWLNGAGTYISTDTKDTRLHNLCTAAKDAGITIFTIGFEVSNTSNLVMKECATSPSHHFDANGTNLAAAFASIAREITKLQLVE